MSKARQGFTQYIADVCMAKRIEQRLSHTQLAHMCHLDVSELRAFESGEKTLALKQLEALIDTLDISLESSSAKPSNHDDLRRQREETQKQALRLLSKSDAIINGFLEQAIQLITKTTSEVLHAEFTGVWLLNEGRNHLDCIDEYILSDDVHEPEYEYSADEFPAWFAEFEGNRNLVHDTVTDDNFDRHHEFEEEREKWKIKSSLESTVIESGEIIGIITTEDIVERKWHLDEISFHNQVADLIMLTVRNLEYRSMQKTMNRKKMLIKQHQNAMFSMMHNEAISEGFIQEACDHITETVANNVNVDSVCIYLVAEDENTFRCMSQYVMNGHRHVNDTRPDDFQFSSFPGYIQALLRERTISSHNVYDDENYAEFAENLLMPEGVVSAADSAVYVHGKLAGIVSLEYLKPYYWSIEEKNFLADVANQVTLSILNCERKKSDHQLQMLSRAIENSSSAVFIAQADHRINYCNPQFAKLLDKTVLQLHGFHIEDFPYANDSSEESCAMLDAISRQEPWRGELELLKRNGDTLWVLFSITALVNENRGSVEYVGVCEDISSLKWAHQEMEQLAFYDPLTGLVNRRLFKERLKQQISVAKRNSGQAAILYLDIDRFKLVNDTLGHDMGDKLLVIIADRLRAVVREQDTVARLGGDEFTVLLPDIKTFADVEVLASKVIAAVSASMEIDGKKLSTTTSIGISLYPEHEQDPAELMKQADMAMYHAKSEGRNNFQLYNEQMNLFSADYLDMEHDLRLALQNKEFILYYQPIVDVKTLAIHKVEALIRWQHPTKGLQSPLSFIPVAEELGLIEAIGDWVLEQACIDLKKIHCLHPNTQMAINLTAGQFSNPELVDKVSAVLNKAGLLGEHLTLEITESMLITHLDRSITTLKGLKKLGVVIAIDDFGTGYSSLSYLKRLPLDFLKVDRSFVKDIPEDINDMEITSAVISMAHKLNLQVVAEGVETEEQMRFLEENDCNYYQGFLFSKPQPIDVLQESFEHIEQIYSNEIPISCATIK